MPTPLPPVVKSMVLCEDVMPGPPGTGNVHLMNVFSAFRPASFPHRHQQVCVFLQLTDCDGQGMGQVQGCIWRLASSSLRAKNTSSPSRTVCS